MAAMLADHEIAPEIVARAIDHGLSAPHGATIRVHGPNDRYPVPMNGPERWALNRKIRRIAVPRGLALMRSRNSSTFAFTALAP
jgi:hypothetical protein